MPEPVSLSLVRNAMTPHTEQARSALRLLQQMKARVDSSAFMALERNIIDLDAENHELSTVVGRTLSAADALIPAVLPKEYNAARLTPSARRLLEHLYAAQGRGITREALYEAVTGREAADQTSDEPLRILDVWARYIRINLEASRPALQAATLPSYLNTIWGQGFVLSHDPPARTIRAERSHSRQTKLTKPEGRILACLKEHKGKPVPLKTLHERANFAGTQTTARRSVSRSISSIRRLLGLRVTAHEGGFYTLEKAT
jgi:DNA-binding response OmpR family regulator